MRNVAALFAVALAAAAPGASAEILDLTFADNSFRVNFAGPLQRIVDVKGQYDAGFVLRPSTDDDLIQVHMGVLLTGDAGARVVDLAAGIGGRVIYVGREHDSGGALAPGGQVEVRWPALERLGLSAYVYGAPEATCFGELRGYLEYAVAVDYDVIRNAAIYVGYREVSYDIGAFEDVKGDDGVHFGLRLKF
jgi:hypothetical protein